MAMKDRITQQPAKAGERSAQSFRRPSGRASYPRRVTLDLTDEQYRWLRATSHQHRISGAGLLRAAIDQLTQDPTELAKVTAAANAAENPDLP